MKQFRALVGETLIHWGMELAAPAWSTTTLRKFGEFLDALRRDM